MKRVKLILGCSLATGLQLNGQVFFGDPSGDTTLLFPIPPKSSEGIAGGGAQDWGDTTERWSGAGMASLDFSQTRVTGGYFLEKENIETGTIFGGLTFGANASNGYANLFNDDSIAGNLDATLFFGHRDASTRDEELGWTHGWWTYKLGYSYGSYTLLDPMAAAGSEISRANENLFDFGAIYTTQVNRDLFGGLAFGFRKESNYSSLSKKTFKQVSAAGSGTVETETEAREGDLEFYEEFYLNFDLLKIITPSQTSVIKNFSYLPAVNLFTRMTFREDDLVVSPGVGLFLVKSGSFTEMLGGVTAIYDGHDDELQIGVSSGFTF